MRSGGATWLLPGRISSQLAPADGAMVRIGGGDGQIGRDTEGRRPRLTASASTGALRLTLRTGFQPQRAGRRGP
jgi:hypothetical protein